MKNLAADQISGSRFADEPIQFTPNEFMLKKLNENMEKYHPIYVLYNKTILEKVDYYESINNPDGS